MSNPTLREELVRITDAVVISSTSTFIFAGHSSNPIVSPMFGVQLNADMPVMIGELTGQLYRNCFSTRFEPDAVRVEMPSTISDTDWLETLSSANQSHERWEDGWQIVLNLPNGRMIAHRGDADRMLSPGEFLNVSAPGMLPAPGMPVRVYLSRESRAMQPGFYFAFGETPFHAADELSIVRFYWNISAEGSPQLLEQASGELNRWQVPFRIKVVSHRGMFQRLDSAVLYTPRRCASIAYELCSEIRERLKPGLLFDTPLFTKRLAAGLAFAEDPGTQESFGMSRCRLLAEGIWLAHVQGARSSGRLAIIEEHFHSQGISLDQPWLNPGSSGRFGSAALESTA